MASAVALDRPPPPESIKAHVLEDGAFVCFYTEGPFRLMRVEDGAAPGAPQLQPESEAGGHKRGHRFPTPSVFAVHRTVRAPCTFPRTRLWLAPVHTELVHTIAHSVVGC